MAKPVDKVVPVVIRRRDKLEVLAFRHPQVGTQLVKGSLEAGEEPEDAALGELAEESGIEDAVVVRPLGQLAYTEIAQHWHFFLCRVTRPLQDEGPFFTDDDGGHLFAFYWHELNEPPDGSWHQDFIRALSLLRRQLHEDKAKH